MQITTDINKIWKTFQRGLIFIFDILLGSAIGFVSFFIYINYISYIVKLKRQSPGT